MIKKWHKSILVESINYDELPKEIKRKIMALTPEDEVLDYEDLFTQLNVDFEGVLDELNEVEDEEKQQYIFDLLMSILPKKNELKHVEKDMAKFDFWNYMSWTLNQEHDVDEFSKEKNQQFIDETLEEWKQEKVSRLVELRERLYKERDERKLELLEKRRNEKLNKAEEKELEYIEQFDDGHVDSFNFDFNSNEIDQVQDIKIDELDSMDEINEPKFDFGDIETFGAGEDNGYNMSEIDLDGDFSEFNPKMNLEEPKEIKEGKFASQQPMEQQTNNQTAEKKIKVEIKEIEKYVTDPALLKKIEEKEQEINKLIQKSQEDIEKEKKSAERIVAGKDEELQILEKKLTEYIENEREQFEKEKEIFEEEIDSRNEKISELKHEIFEMHNEDEEAQKEKEALIRAATLEELKKMKKQDLRRLCDRLTINYSKTELKESLINKLVLKAKKLERVYNQVDIEDEVERRLEIMKNNKDFSATKELTVDPFENINNQQGLDDPFSNGNDPFGDLVQDSGMDDMFGGGSDPFGNIDMSGGMDDMFGGGNDPFANVDTNGGMDDEFGSSSDPFANVDTSGGMDDEFGGGNNDPFANVKNDGGMDDSFSSSSDPFSNLNMQQAGLTDSTTPTETEEEQPLKKAPKKKKVRRLIKK